MPDKSSSVLLLCLESPNQRHYWVINCSNKGICKYCQEIRQFSHDITFFGINKWNKTSGKHHKSLRHNKTTGNIYGGLYE